MATVITNLDTRRSKSDGTFNIIFRISHLRKVYTINSGISIHEMYWDSSFRRVNKAHPNSKLLNIKLSKEWTINKNKIKAVAIVKNIADEFYEDFENDNLVGREAYFQLEMELN